MWWWWSYDSVPELKRLPAEDRRRVWRRCRRSAFTNWRFWAWATLTGSGHLLVFVCTDALVDYATPADLLDTVSFATTYAVTVLGFPAYAYLVAHFARHEIRRTVGGVCVACGYDLRATPGRCPECGAAAAGR